MDKIYKYIFNNKKKEIEKQNNNITLIKILYEVQTIKTQQVEIKNLIENMTLNYDLNTIGSEDKS